MNMKKDLIFAPILVLVYALLFLYDFIGGGAHIAIAIIGAFVLAIYTSATRKEWKIPALEILMRAFYGIALITGIVLLNVEGVVALGLVHKISATLFVALLVVLFALKLIAKKASK